MWFALVSGTPASGTQQGLHTGDSDSGNVKGHWQGAPGQSSHSCYRMPGQSSHSCYRWAQSLAIVPRTQWRHYQLWRLTDEVKGFALSYSTHFQETMCLLPCLKSSVKDYPWDSHLGIPIPILSFLPHQAIYPMFQKEPLSHSFFDDEPDLVTHFLKIEKHKRKWEI